MKLFALHAVKRSVSSPLAAEILETVPVLMRVIRGEMRRQRGPALSMAEFRALSFIGRHEGTGLSAVAEHVGLSLPSTSRIIDSLIGTGLVLRAASPRDRRRLFLKVTDQGRLDMERLRSSAGRHLRARVGQLDPLAQSEMVRALRSLRLIFSEVEPIADDLAEEPLHPDISVPIVPLS